MTTNVPQLDRSVHKTNAWLADLDEAFGWDDRERTYKALRSVLQALRDRLEVDEATQLAAQLPLLVKGVFYDGWNPTDLPVTIRSRDEFLDRILESYGDRDFSDPQHVTETVFRHLDSHVSEGEIADVKATLPEEIRTLWP